MFGCLLFVSWPFLDLGSRSTLLQVQRPSGSGAALELIKIVGALGPGGRFVLYGDGGKVLFLIPVLSPHSCWLRLDTYFIWSFIGPATLIIMVSTTPPPPPLINPTYPAGLFLNGPPRSVPALPGSEPSFLFATLLSARAPAGHGAVRENGWGL